MIFILYSVVNELFENCNEPSFSLTNFSSLSKKTSNTIATLGNTTLVTGITDTQPTKSDENTMNSKAEVATKNLSFNPKRAEMRDRLDEMFGKILNKV